jgi:hypothetical protein
VDFHDLLARWACGLKSFPWWLWLVPICKQTCILNTA